MSNSNVIDLKDPVLLNGDPLTELLRQGAGKLIQAAIEDELQILLSSLTDRKIEGGRAAVVRNGYLPERELQTGIGPVTVSVPKIRSKDGRPVTFHSALVPP